MGYEDNTVRTLYRRLISFYPRRFREELGESMEQTFNDLCKEKRQSKRGLPGFVLLTFIETAMGIFREYMVLISSGDLMHSMLKNTGLSAFLGFLLILPFMIMELVNRRNFNEDFPFVLFFGLWFNLFAISLLLLPIVRGRWIGNRESANPIPAQRNTLLTNPRSALIISVLLILSIVFLSVLDSLDWAPLERLLKGPNPEQLYVFGVQVPSQLIAFTLILIPVAAGIIAGRPIVSGMRAGGSLFARPIHLIIVALIVSTFAIGFASLLIDQWPCFIGVPNCD